MGDNSTENGTSKRRRGLHVVWQLPLGVLLAILVVAAAVGDEDRDVMKARVAIDLLTSWLGLIFVVASPLVGMWMLRTRELAWVVLPAVAFFLAGAILLGAHGIGVWVALSVLLLVVGAQAWRGGATPPA